ncbi:hypothetical protein D3C71_1269450 [compost metagenome]
MAICANVVSMPCPWECTPTRSSSPPSGVTRAVAWSNPGMTGVPQAANTDVPWAACSVYVARPTPIRRPSASPRRWRSRTASTPIMSMACCKLAG